MSDVKRVMMQKFVVGTKMVVKVRTSKYYKFDEDNDYQSLLKRGKKELERLNENIPLQPEISNEKKKDVAILLAKLFGNSWLDDPNLAWYAGIVDVASNQNDANDPGEEETECDCNEPDTGILHI